MKSKAIPVFLLVTMLAACYTSPQVTPLITATASPLPATSSPETRPTLTPEGTPTRALPAEVRAYLDPVSYTHLDLSSVKGPI